MNEYEIAEAYEDQVVVTVIVIIAFVVMLVGLVMLGTEKRLLCLNTKWQMVPLASLIIANKQGEGHIVNYLMELSYTTSKNGLRRKGLRRKKLWGMINA